MKPKCYWIHGIAASSDYPLQCPSVSRKPQVIIRRRSAAFFKKLHRLIKYGKKPSRFRYAVLSDHSEYVRYQNLGEFWISPNGATLYYRRLTAEARFRESFFQYLAINALSFALVKLGREPLHATALEYNGRAMALVGDSGFGKSTLSMALIREGFRLLTDDLLSLSRKQGRLYALPGIPRVKLVSRTARFFFRASYRGFPMNPKTRKRIYRLPEQNLCRTPTPLKKIYLLSDLEKVRGRKWRGLRPVKGKTAVMEIINAFYNLCAGAGKRDAKQFQCALEIVKKINLLKIYYPLGFSHLSSMARILKRDLENPDKETRI